MKKGKIMYRVIAFVLTFIVCLFAVSCRRDEEEIDDSLYTVSFEYGYGDKVLTEEVTNGSKVTKPNDPIRVGYDFHGWWIPDGDEERLWDFENDVVLSDITLTAKWSDKTEKTYTVSLNANGGVCEVDKIEVLPGEEYSLPTPTREGYFFLCWGNVSNEGVWNYDNDMTLYAEWLTYPPGMTIKIGHFEQDNDLTNGAEEIEWEVIKYDDGKYFVISKYILTAMTFNENSKDMKWANSSLRKWMNGEFLETAFSDAEREYIQDTYIKSELTTDKVFCISYHTLLMEIGDKRVKFGKPSEYALSKGIQPKGDKVHYWEDEMRVTYDFYLISGKVGSVSGSGSAGETEGVRPAMWISEEYLESLK